ncbi:MAG: hypothetical protein ACRD3W_10075, partial [Terriglobales bacterium]
ACCCTLLLSVLGLTGCGRSPQETAAESAAMQQKAAVKAQAELDADQARLRNIIEHPPVPESEGVRQVKQKAIRIVACASGKEPCSPSVLCYDLKRMELKDVRAILGRPEREQKVGDQFFTYYTFVINDGGTARTARLQLVGAWQVDDCNYY